MAGTIKKTTGLVGLKVSKNPHHTLAAVYAKILRVVAKIPEDAAYRKHTHKVICKRLNIVESTPDIKQLEEAIGCGQAEELIVQAENELILARKMLIWKPWESLKEPAPDKQWDWPPSNIMHPKI